MDNTEKPKNRCHKYLLDKKSNIIYDGKTIDVKEYIKILSKQDYIETNLDVECTPKQKIEAIRLSIEMEDICKFIESPSVADIWDRAKQILNCLLSEKKYTFEQKAEAVDLSILIERENDVIPPYNFTHVWINAQKLLYYIYGEW